MSLIDAFLDGVTGAGLFARLRWPGAPTELIDSRSPTQFDAASRAAALANRHGVQSTKTYARRSEQELRVQQVLDDLHPDAK